MCKILGSRGKLDLTGPVSMLLKEEIKPYKVERMVSGQQRQSAMGDHFFLPEKNGLVYEESQ